MRAYILLLVLSPLTEHALSMPDRTQTRPLRLQTPKAPLASNSGQLDLKSPTKGDRLNAGRLISLGSVAKSGNATVVSVRRPATAARSQATSKMRTAIAKTFTSFAQNPVPNSDNERQRQTSSGKLREKSATSKQATGLAQSKGKKLCRRGDDANNSCSNPPPKRAHTRQIHIPPRDVPQVFDMEALRFRSYRREDLFKDPSFGNYPEPNVPPLWPTTAGWTETSGGAQSNHKNAPAYQEMSRIAYSPNKPDHLPTIAAGTGGIAALGSTIPMVNWCAVGGCVGKATCLATMGCALGSATLTAGLGAAGLGLYAAQKASNEVQRVDRAQKGKHNASQVSMAYLDGLHDPLLRYRTNENPRSKEILPWVTKGAEMAQKETYLERSYKFREGRRRLHKEAHRFRQMSIWTGLVAPKNDKEEEESRLIQARLGAPYGIPPYPRKRETWQLEEPGQYSNEGPRRSLYKPGAKNQGSDLKRSNSLRQFHPFEYYHNKPATKNRWPVKPHTKNELETPKWGMPDPIDLGKMLRGPLPTDLDQRKAALRLQYKAWQKTIDHDSDADEKVVKALASRPIPGQKVRRVRSGLFEILPKSPKQDRPESVAPTSGENRLTDIELQDFISKEPDMSTVAKVEKAPQQRQYRRVQARIPRQGLVLSRTVSAPRLSELGSLQEPQAKIDSKIRSNVQSSTSRPEDQASSSQACNQRVPTEINSETQAGSSQACNQKVPTEIESEIDAWYSWV